MTQPRVELVYDEACPNVGGARAALLRAFAKTGLPAHWTEWLRTAADAPDHVRQYGSPSILVNGRDVTGETAGGSGPSCRLYPTFDGRFGGVPSVETIAARLSSTQGSVDPVSDTPSTGRTDSVRGRWLGSLGFVTALGAVLLPACPACWPLYLGVAGALGLPLLFDANTLVLSGLALVGITLGSLAYGAVRRRRFGPVALGGAGCVLFLPSKFILPSPVLFYGGSAMFLMATLWNVWSLRRTGSHRVVTHVIPSPGADT